MRHGESLMNTQPHLIGGRANETPLTERGVEQARLLGRYLLAHDVLPTEVFASPAVRTLQTAKHALTEMGLAVEPTVADELQEMDQGDFVGRHRAEVYTPEVLLEINRQGKDFKLSSGESMNDVGMRMLTWIQANVPTESQNGIERTFVFGHGMAIRSLVSVLESWSRLQTYESVTQNTSITLLSHQDEQWRLAYLGATPHLSDE